MTTRTPITTKLYERFTVHVLDKDHSFIHFSISDSNEFYRSFSEFILNDDRLIKFIKNKKDLKFEPTRRNYVSIAKRLDLFIDDEIKEIPIDASDIEEILHDEFNGYRDSDGTFKVKLSTIGRFGEYIFHTLLSEYFGFDCIIPKIALTTDKNMSVYGIDELFYDAKNKRILFGESKVSKSLANGIALVKKSLKDYEKQISEEFVLCLSEQLIQSQGLPEEFLTHIENTFTFQEFTQAAQIASIGVPICICHGLETSPERILQMLKSSFDKKTLFGIATEYYCISLPVISKEILASYITAAIKMRIDEIKNPS